MPEEHMAKTFRAAYHPIVDEHEWPIANLLLILSPEGYPNRAELHLNPDAPALTTTGDDALVDLALAKAETIIKRSYRSNNPSMDKLEVRVLNVEQHSPPTHFDIDYRDDVEQRSAGAWYLPALIAAAMILVGAIWGISTLLNRTGAGSETTVPSGSDTLAEIDDSASPVLPSVVDNGAQVAANPQGANPPNIVAATVPAQAAPQTNGLPPSQNANNNLDVGQRVRVIPGSALTLRTQPGAEAGEAIGFMQNAEGATIVGGPHWVQGLSDTIVWWYVQLDDGRQAWAPANDSQFTLLEPAP